MNLVIDIGNTFVKVAVFEENTIVFQQKYKVINASFFFEISNKYAIKKAIISSVRTNETEINELLQKFNIPFSWLSTQLKFPFQIHYKTPLTLGLDRLAAVAGVFAIYPNQHVLVVDLGTCITFDFIDENVNYFGGSIAPGFEMRLKALQHFTQKLPLITYTNQKIDLIGNTTENSILSGVYNGLKHEIEGTILTYQQQYNNLKVVFTGGDNKLFELATKNRIFADEFLVLKGLNTILNYNEQI